MRARKKDLVVARERSERGSHAKFDRTDGRSPDVRKDEAPYTGSLRRALHGTPIEMAADRAAEADRPVPRRCLREHEVGVSRPRRKFKEFGRPDYLQTAAPDLVAECRMARVHDRSRLDPQISRMKRCDLRRELKLARASANRGGEFRVIISEPHANLADITV